MTHASSIEHASSTEHDHARAAGSAGDAVGRFAGRAVAVIAAAIRRRWTLRTLRALSPEVLRDCGLDPSLSRDKPVSPDQARTMTYLMSLR